MNEKKQIAFFEKYLTIWVLLCILAGIIIGKLAGAQMSLLSDLNLFHVNIPIAILVWLMIYPMMVQIDFTSIRNAGKKPKGFLLTLAVNWLVKPFSMAFFAWVFFHHLYAAWLSPEQAKDYVAGAILLGAAPCTAMVFVWSYLTDGDPAYTLIQVSLNDLLILVLFVPIVGFLLGIAHIIIPYETLISSVVIFVVIPLAAGFVSRFILLKAYGEIWFRDVFMKALKPVSVLALLLTLVLLFAFQGNIILKNPLIILMIAVPFTIQSFSVFFLTWFAGKYIKLPHNICAPAAMIGGSNFFELAVAVAIALFGINSGAALATVVGVLVEVPVMLALVSLANRWKY